MARPRRQPESLEFGSDSFLDIVANIVGILIILIVIAGVRMSQVPLLPVTTAEQPDAVTPLEVAQADELPQETSSTGVAVSQTPVPDEASPVDPGAGVESLSQEQQPKPVVITFDIDLGAAQSLRAPIPPEPASKLARIEQELAEQRRRQSAEQQRLEQIQQAITQTETQLKKTAADNSELATLRRSLDDDEKLTTASLAVLMRQKANLDEQLVLIQQSGKPAQTIQHSMVPVSRQVAGHEWHFEVREGKVSFIPLDELLGQLKGKVERWAEWIAKYDTHEGVVGPVDGYSLEYRVSKQRQSLAHELAAGGTFRIGVDRWELVPGQRRFAETGEQARAANSQFRSALNRCSFEDTITLWVYPDSFQMYQELSRIAHELGYQVAARPLPTGKRIGGSPNGSKSFSQ